MRFLLSYADKSFEVNSAVWHHIVNQEELESISVDDDVVIACLEDVEVYREIKNKWKHDSSVDWIGIFENE